MNLVAVRMDGEMLSHLSEMSDFIVRCGLCTPFAFFLFLCWPGVLCVLHRPRLLSLSGCFWIVSAQGIRAYVAIRRGSSPITNKFDDALFSCVTDDSYFGVCLAAIVALDGIPSYLL